MDAVAARLVRGSRHDASIARPTTAHDDRPAAQLRAVALLNGREEGVEVHVQDRRGGPSRGDPSLAGHAIIIARPGGSVRPGSPVRWVDQPLGSTTTVTSGVMPAKTFTATL